SSTWNSTRTATRSSTSPRNGCTSTGSRSPTAPIRGAPRRALPRSRFPPEANGSPKPRRACGDPENPEPPQLPARHRRQRCRGGAVRHLHHGLGILHTGSAGVRARGGRLLPRGDHAAADAEPAPPAQLRHQLPASPLPAGDGDHSEPRDDDVGGAPANSIYDREAGVVRTLDQPTDLRAPTLLDRLHDRGLVTGSVLSKEYLHGIFGDRATVRWEPDPVVPISGHAPDAATCDALMSMVDSADPVLVFANFGDADRVGHVDLTGTTLRAARRAALASTDFQLGRFADFLVRTGRWDNSILFVLA